MKFYSDSRSRLIFLVIGPFNSKSTKLLEYFLIILSVCVFDCKRLSSQCHRESQKKPCKVSDLIIIADTGIQQVGKNSDLFSLIHMRMWMHTSRTRPGHCCRFKNSIAASSKICTPLLLTTPHHTLPLLHCPMKCHWLDKKLFFLGSALDASVRSSYRTLHYPHSSTFFL